MNKQVWILIVVLLLATSVIGQKSDQLFLTPTEIKPVRASKKEIAWAKKFGAVNAREFLNNAEEVHDVWLQGYLNQLLHKVVSQAPKHFQEFKYSVKIVADDASGAIAFSNGEIIIGMPLLCEVDYEDVLVVILAHEVAHPALRHKIGVVRLSSQQQIQERKFINPKGNLYEANRLSERNAKLLLEYFQRNEVESDLMGVRIAMNAGYDPTKAVEHMQSSTAFVIDDEHPPAKVRAEKMTTEIAVWKQKLPWWQQIAHPVPEFLKNKCAEYGLP